MGLELNSQDDMKGRKEGRRGGEGRGRQERDERRTGRERGRRGMREQGRNEEAEKQSGR